MVRFRLQNIDIPGIKLSHSAVSKVTEGHNITDALELYLRLKGRDKDKVFVRTATRNIEYVVDALGSRIIADYSSSDAAAFRDYLLTKNMTVRTVKRVFSSVRSIINLSIREKGLSCSNAFSGTFFPEETVSKIRKPISNSHLKKVHKLCLKEDDEMRWAIALVSDTGMRLGEAIGLLKSDIILDAKIPYIDLKPHHWRGLKTTGSERQIPLVGMALWAAKRIKSQSTSSPYAFTRYCYEYNCKTNSASGGLNKWLKEHISSEAVIHGFRHSMRDRLRDVECPFDIVNAIGGWTTAGVGSSYGAGYSLEVKHKWLKQATKLP